jgi:glucose-6-phosphate dehydrogenase assembly protein OpcA
MLESVNEKMDKEQFHDYMQYVLKTQFKTPEEKKMKKSIIKKLNIANKKKGLRLFKEISGVQLAKKVVKNQQYEKGMDLFTAQYIVQTYDAYKKHPTLRKKIEKLSVAKAVKLANLVMRGS